jgi:hypothetical protein
MKTITVKELKTELDERSHNDLLEICLRLSKFKKENKELLTYLIYESADEQGYINSIKREIDESFELVNAKNYYFIKKGTRKILRRVKTYIRYSKIKETEIDLLIYFCQKLKDFTPSVEKSIVLTNMHNREVESIKKKVATLHEDLQFDYEATLAGLDIGFAI